jgi:hypothetical protein
MPTPDATPNYSGVIFEAVAEKELAVDGGRSRHTQLSVNKVYRGEVPKKVAARHGGMSGYPPFIIGRKYLVFASLRSPDSAPSKFGPTVYVHLCHATHLLPRQGPFAKGPWIGFDPVKAFGASHPPGDALVGARPGQPTPDPPKPIATPPAPEPESPQPAPKASTTTPPPPTPTPKSSRGCGCVLVGRGVSSRAGWCLALMALCLVSRRRLHYFCAINSAS